MGMDHFCGSKDQAFPEEIFPRRALACVDLFSRAFSMN